MEINALCLAYTQWSTVNKAYAGTLSEQHFLYEQSQGDGNRPLKFHKSVVGNDMWKKMAHMLAYFLQIKVFQTAIAGIMEKDYYKHDFCL